MERLQKLLGASRMTEKTDENPTSESSRLNDSPLIFEKFFDLPAELRELVYESYFDDANTILASKHQPRTRHADALLWVSRRIHAEAKPIMFRKATFTISLAKEHAPYPEHDCAYMIDHHYKRADYVATSVETVQQFQKVQLLLDQSSPGCDIPHWQHLWPVLLGGRTMLRPGQQLSIRIKIKMSHVYDGITSLAMLGLWRQASSVDFMAPNPRAKDIRRKRSKMTAERLLARGDGNRFKSVISMQARETFCFTRMLSLMGKFVACNEGLMRLESLDRKHVKAIKASSVQDVLDQAGEMGDENDIWLVVEGKVVNSCLDIEEKPAGEKVVRE